MSINISSYLEETKKCAKAYAKLYDDLTLWNSKIDNYTKIKDSFNKIKKLNDNLNNLNLDVVCKKIKSAKNSEQIMEAFGL